MGLEPACPQTSRGTPVERREPTSASGH